MSEPLIAPRPFVDFSPEEYHDYVTAMYCLRVKAGKKAAPVPGLTVSRTKAGALTVRRGKQRAFDYVTRPEIAALAKVHTTSQADIWNLFRRKGYIIADDRMQAEQTYADIKEIPWDYGPKPRRKHGKGKKVDKDDKEKAGNEASAEA